MTGNDTAEGGTTPKGRTESHKVTLVRHDDGGVDVLGVELSQNGNAVYSVSDVFTSRLLS